MEKNEITVIGRAETMTSLEIAEVIGKRHSDVMRDIRNLITQGVGERNFALTSYIDKSNRQSPCYELTWKGCLILASGYDALLREKIINRWEELEIKERKRQEKERIERETMERAKQAAIQNARRDLVEAQIAAIEGVKKLINPGSAHILAMTNEVLVNCGLKAIDYIKSDGVFHSATYLLKTNGINMSARKFNQIAVNKGVLVYITRSSSKGQKKFLNIPKEYLAYGENGVSEHNPKETQPNWYDEKFPELLNILGIRKESSLAM